MHITELLSLSVERGASDLHLSTGVPPMLRIDGDIEPLDLPVLDAAEVRAACDQVRPSTANADVGPETELDFCFDAADLARFRVNVFRHHHGPAAVFRVVPTKAPTMAELDMGAVFRQIADAPRGLVLVTGPTGSGKSTTLAAMVDYVNNARRQHILTIEDPIEFVHASRRCLVTQRQLGRDSRDYASALRAALREDPDVILIGEMRDAETIRLALTAAETGHLVFATLHTPSAPAAVDRIVDVFPGAEKAAIRTIFSESLHAVVAQILLKSVAGGRVAAHEIMIATPAVRNLIREHKAAQLYSAMQTAGATGMQTLDQCLHGLLRTGVIDVEEARQKARFPDTFARSSADAGRAATASRR